MNGQIVRMNGERWTMKIENVTTNDAEELLEIYAPYVRDTAITFEYEVPSV